MAFWGLFLLLFLVNVVNAQVIYSSPPPPPTVVCTACATCENPCTPVLPAYPPPPPPPAAPQIACPPPPADLYPYGSAPPPPSLSPPAQFPYYPYYTINGSPPLVNTFGSCTFFCLLFALPALYTFSWLF